MYFQGKMKKKLKMQRNQPLGLFRADDCKSIARWSWAEPTIPGKNSSPKCKSRSLGCFTSTQKLTLKFSILNFFTWCLIEHKWHAGVCTQKPTKSMVPRMTTTESLGQVVWNGAYFGECGVCISGCRMCTVWQGPPPAPYTLTTCCFQVSWQQFHQHFYPWDTM